MKRNAMGTDVANGFFINSFFCELRFLHRSRRLAAERRQLKLLHRTKLLIGIIGKIQEDWLFAILRW